VHKTFTIKKVYSKIFRISDILRNAGDSRAEFPVRRPEELLAVL